MKLLVSLLVLCGMAIAQVAETPDVATAPMQNVSVLVSVMDKSGAPVNGVRKEQLSGLIDGTRAAQVLDIRAATELPVHIALVLTASKTDFGQQQAAAIELAKRVLRPNVDKAFVITAGGDKQWSNEHLGWLTDAGSVEKTVRALNKNEGFPDPFSYELNHEGVNGDRFAIQHYGATDFNVYNVIWAMFANDPRPARRIVVMFRKPSSHSPGVSGTWSKVVEAEHAQRIAEAQKRKASFYMIALDEPVAVDSSLTQIYAPVHAGESSASRGFDYNLNKMHDRVYSTGRANLERMAQDTAGKVWFSKKSKFSDAVDAIANQLAGQYVVSFAAPAIAPGSSHVLQLNVNAPNAEMYAPKAYFEAPARAPQSSMAK